MDLRSIFIANGTGIFLLLMLLYISHSRTIRNHAEDRLFTFMVWGVMIGCLMESLSYTIDGKIFPFSRILNYGINTYLFTVNLLLPFCVLVYVDLGLYNNPKRIWQYYKPQVIIGIIMIAANIVNFFIPIIYYITKENVYERRPGTYLYYVVILFYLISAMLVTHRYEKENGDIAFFNVNMFVLPIIIGAGLQFCFYGLSLAWLSAAVGLTGLYMMQQNEIAYVDSLADVYNRQYLKHILSSWTSQKIHFAGAMIDIDNFKSINDRYGHSEGDRALITIANILKKSRVDNEWVFRFAGDEFIILKRSESPEELRPYFKKLHANLDDYNRHNPPCTLEISYGISYFETGQIDAFMKDIDDRMYEMKKKHHQES